MKEVYRNLNSFSKVIIPVRVVRFYLSRGLQQNSHHPVCKAIHPEIFSSLQITPELLINPLKRYFILSKQIFTQ